MCVPQIPSAKMLTFFRSNTFELDAEYENMALLPAGTAQRISSFMIGPLPVPKDGGKAKLKVKVRLNLHGIVSVESAQVVEEEDAEGGDTKMDDAGEAGGDKDTDAKRKVKKVEVPVQAITASLSPAKLQELTEKEFEMALQDRVMEETKERKNAVESYVLGMRSKLADSLAPFATDAARDALVAKLQQVEDWLYEEGEDVAKGVYVQQLEDLRALGDPIEERAKEDNSRGPAAAALRKSAEGFLAQTSEVRHSAPRWGCLSTLAQAASSFRAAERIRRLRRSAMPISRPRSWRASARRLRQRCSGCRRRRPPRRLSAKLTPLRC